ncbi:MAG: LuxR C-terminal-related transcriptional regulator [Pseudomonadota bacterium]
MRDILDLVTKLQDGSGRSWDHSRDFFKKQGFDGIACGAVEHNTGTLAGLFFEMPNDWQLHYGTEKYIEIDPWAKKSLTTKAPFIFTFEKRFAKFPNPPKRLLDMYTDMKEANIVNSVLLPAFQVDEFMIGLNLWSFERESAFLRNIQHNLTKLSVAGSVVRAHLKDDAITKLYVDKKSGWIRHPSYKNPLTDREMEALKWLASGLQYDQIGDRMNISVPTVTFHLQNARSKLNARTREQALAIAIVRRFIDP